MNAGETIVYLVGALLVIGGLAMLLFRTVVAGWIPAGIALAGLVVLFGAFVIGLSRRTGTKEHVEHNEHHHHRDD